VRPIDSACGDLGLKAEDVTGLDAGRAEVLVIEMGRGDPSPHPVISRELIPSGSGRPGMIC
jgi:hypothetical protein